MFHPRIPIAALVALAMAGSAWSVSAAAQTASQGAGDGTAGTLNLAELRELDDDRTDITWEGRTLDELEDMDVYDSSGRQVGEVEDILGDGQNNVVAFVVESGGFLGIGDDEAVVSVDHVALDADRNSLIINLSEEQMRNLQRWERD